MFQQAFTVCSPLKSQYCLMVLINGMHLVLRHLGQIERIFHGHVAEHTCIKQFVIPTSSSLFGIHPSEPLTKYS